MLVFIETLFVLMVLYYFYQVAFKKVRNPLRIPRALAIAILIIGFLVLPAPIKTLILIIVVIAFIVNQVTNYRMEQ